MLDNEPVLCSRADGERETARKVACSRALTAAIALASMREEWKTGVPSKVLLSSIESSSGLIEDGAL